MCLFLTALLRDGRITLDEYGIEIREFCLLFAWVVEAADVSQSERLDADDSYFNKYWVN